ncbi:MAG: TRAP transporter fused permease subunit [Acidobacteria bacterium]|nr:TRAP transporter fused permease subunit [Acidobacteriota bacterium]
MGATDTTNHHRPAEQPGDPWSKAAVVACGLFAVFQLTVPVLAPLYDLQLRSLHVWFALSVAFLLYPSLRRGRAGVPARIACVLWLAVLAASNLYVFLNWLEIQTYPGEPPAWGLFLAVLLLAAVLESARRATGWAIPVIVLFMFVYVFLGSAMPGIWRHPGFPLEYVLGSVYSSSLGIYGAITGTSATFISMFLIFGAMLGATGGGRTFMDLALLTAGRFRGGPAKVAVAASALFGSISGSSIANVSVTGNYTIPLMVRLGYGPDFAGGVAAISSTGGGFTPPIMGISAFIMAESTGIPYAWIIVYALVPCLLFYSGVTAGIHFEALRLNLPRLPREETPQWRAVVTWPRMVPLLAPLCLLLAMLYRGSSLTTAGWYACVALVSLFLFADLSWKGLQSRAFQVGRALSDGGRAAAIVAPILVAVNVFTHLLGLTGVAPKISGLIVDLGGGSILGALLVAALVPFVLGTALPTAATYILSVALIAPALMRLGLDIVAVHMFLIYWATLAAVTPPTCTGCIIAAGMGGGNWLKTAFVGMRLGVVAFLIPFFFVLEPALVGREALSSILLHSASALAGSIAMAAGFFGFLRTPLNTIQRSVLVGIGVLLMYPDPYLSILGVSIGALLFAAGALIRKHRPKLVPRAGGDPSPDV